jgi:hypothetical protein
VGGGGVYNLTCFLIGKVEFEVRSSCRLTFHFFAGKTYARLARFFPPGPRPPGPFFFRLAPARLAPPKVESGLARLVRPGPFFSAWPARLAPPKAESDLVRVYLWLPRPA